MLGEQLDGGKGYLGGQEQDWMGCLEHDLPLIDLPIEQKQWTLAAQKSGKRFRRVEEAAEQHMKHWFGKEKETWQNDERLRYRKRSNLRRRWVQGPGRQGKEPR